MDLATYNISRIHFVCARTRIVLTTGPLHAAVSSNVGLAVGAVVLRVFEGGEQQGNEAAAEIKPEEAEQSGKEPGEASVGGVSRGPTEELALGATHLRGDITEQHCRVDPGHGQLDRQLIAFYGVSGARGVRRRWVDDV